MLTVHKFALDTRTQVITLPSWRRFRSVGVQHLVPVVYYEVDTTYPSITLTIQAIPTGEEVPRGATYLGSVQVETTVDTLKYLVWHIYEVPA